MNKREVTRFTREEIANRVKELGKQISKDYAEKEGYAVKMKEYKKSPELFKGSIADLTGVLRLAITGRQNAPDLWAVQQLLGLEKVKERIIKYTDYLS